LYSNKIDKHFSRSKNEKTNLEDTEYILDFFIIDEKRGLLSFTP